MTLTERIFALKATPPFDRLRDGELALIADVARVRCYAPGEPVCGVEMPLHRLHVVVEGGIVGSGGERVPAVFGVAALLFDAPMTDTYVASSPEGATCLLINKGNFYTAVHECPGLIAGLLEEPGAIG